MSRNGVNRSIAEWLHSQETTPTYLEEILTRTRRERQRPAWSFAERWIPMQPTMRRAAMPRLSLAVAAASLVAVVAAVALFLPRSPAPSVGSPDGMPSSSASAGATLPAPSSPTPRPSDAGPEHRPVAPESPLPSPGGQELPDELVGREYASEQPAPSSSQQQLIMTLRAADDPHCTAMFDGKSTCFTLLWEPNTGNHENDPGARGAARVVDGELVLTFSIVPYDLACEGLEYAFAIEGDGSRLRGVVVPEGGCGFPDFYER